MNRRFNARRALALLGMSLLSTPLWATDGVIEINQARAIAGGVTAGDTPNFPVMISTPGSYRLTGNLTVPDANTTAIFINADNVSIDLNGFTISGPNTCSWNGTPLQVVCLLNGIGSGVTALKRNIEVRNGLIYGFGDWGVSALSGRFTDLRVRENQGGGVRLIEGTLSRIASELNGIVGIQMDEGTISESIANKNGATGFSLTDVNVTGVVATKNVGHGISAAHSIVSKAIVRDNGVDGIVLFSGSIVVDSNIDSNGGVGLNPQGAAATYRGNRIGGNLGANVGLGGTQLGPNLCNTALCP